MQLFPCLPTAHPLFSIIICFLKLLSINNESRQRETSLLLIWCHITSKTAPAKRAENGDGFNWKHPHLLHPSKINEAKALWRHTGKFNPTVVLGTIKTRDFETIKQIVGKKQVPGRVCLFLPLDLAPHHPSTAMKLLKAKSSRLICPLNPKLCKEINKMLLSPSVWCSKAQAPPSSC